MPNTVKEIDLERLLDSDQPNYSDGEIILMDNPAGISANGTVKLNMLIMAYCTRGDMQGEINDKIYRMGKGDVMICLPNSFVTNITSSQDLDIKIIGLSYDALQHGLNIDKHSWNMLTYISAHPIVHLEDSRLAVFEKYYELLTYKKDIRGGYYNKKIMDNLFECAFYEIAAIIAPRLQEDASKRDVSHGDLIFKRFIELLTENEGRNRSVKSYAEQLCITPKYLSAVSKAASGWTALEWIHHMATRSIARQLKHSDKSIKEISNRMEFPNLSFFGRFVKAHLGVSPSEYRRNVRNNKL